MGNPTTYTGQSLSFDGLDQMTAFGSSLTAGYDSSGLRAWKQSARTGGKAYTFYAGSSLVAETTSSGTLLTVDTFGPMGLLSSQTGPSSETFYAFDPRGNVAQRVNTSGAVVSSDHYNAYGQQLNSPSGDEFGFGGQAGYRTDPETGLCLLGQRYYDPSAGRFLNRDPLGYAGGMDLYAYCGDDPVNNMDPSGLSDAPWWQQSLQVVQGMGKNVLQTAVSMSLPGQIVGQVQMAQMVGEYGAGAAGCMMLSGVVHAFTDFATTSDPERFGESFSNLLMLLPSDGESAEGEVAAAAQRAARGGCFVAGTVVQTAHGTKPIQRVRTGDRVWSRDPLTGKTELRRVVRTYKHLARETITVRLADGSGRIVQTLEATPNHPFFVVGRGPVALGKLGIGTQVVTRAGPPLVVRSLARHHHPRGVLVYNLEVQGDHTYFVGTAGGGAWVHNACGGWTSPGGLEYETGSAQGNRVMHVFDHLTENPDKQTHSVFNVDTSGEALGMIDEAWGMRGAPEVGDPGAYVVGMGRAVGTRGETNLRIIVRPGTNRIITAYPTF